MELSSIKLRGYLLTAVAFMTACLFNGLCPAFAMESRNGSNLRGVDVSHWNGHIDWSQLTAHNVSFAYIKATTGHSTIDPLFTENAINARKHGVAVGPYHYANPSAPFNASQPVQEAQFFVRAVHAAMPDYGNVMPVVDVEQAGGLSPNQLAEWIRIFAQTVERQTHREVMLYTSEDFLQRHAGFDSKLRDIPLWVAYYDRLNGGKIPPNIAGWSHWAVWQYSDKARIPGVSGEVDLDAGPTSLAALKGAAVPSDTNSVHRPVLKKPVDSLEKDTGTHSTSSSTLNRKRSHGLVIYVIIGCLTTGALVVGVFVWLFLLRGRKHHRMLDEPQM